MSQIVVEATSRHTASIIFSHGLGDSASGWAPFAQSIKSRFPHVKWILPTASMKPVTLNGGMKMNSWYDIKSLAPGGGEDERGMLESSSRISALISQEVDNGIPAERIIVGGFSQGSVIALLTGLTSERKLAGIVSLSGYLGLSEKIHTMKSERAHLLPIFWGHGTADPVVSYKWGEQSRDKLLSLGFNKLEFHTYPRMGHSMCDQEQEDLVAFLEKVLPPL